MADEGVLTELRDEGRQLQAAVQAEQAMYRKTTKLIAWALGASFLVSVTSVVLAGTIVYFQVQSKERGLTIKDCIVASGECYQRNLKNQQDAIKLLVTENRASNKVLAQCLLTVDTEAELDTCVDQRLKEGAP